MSLRIEARGLTKVFGTRTVVEALTFEVSAGEVFGLLGPNGAGKTTAIRMLAGLLTPTRGTATVCGVDLPASTEQSSLLRARVGLLTEQPGLYERLTARENIEFFVRLKERERERAREIANTYLARFGLADRADEPVGGFSKGMRQKLAIVRTLIHEPEVIFLDEPTSGLDPEAARAVREVVEELARDGRTLVLCSHNLSEVERLCSRVAVVKTTLRKVASLVELRRAAKAVEVAVVGNAADYVHAIAALGFAHLVEGNKLTVFLPDVERTPDIVTCLVGAGARIVAVGRASRSLEAAYLELMHDEAN